MKQVHYILGLTITSFIAVHLFNHLLSVLGVDTYMAFMDKMRLIYRSKAGETVLLTAVVIQIISGLRLFFAKRKRVDGFYEKLQIWTGLYLAIFLIVHVGAVLTGRYILELDTNFYFGAAGLNTFPLNLFFIPYYGAAILSFFGHVAAIHYLKMKREVFRLSVTQQSRFILLTGIIVTIVVLYGLTNGFQGVEIPKAYDVLIGK
ncbi:hypothetical protein D1164_09085 [Mariniphaga sediminis]|uniref:Succinate dehydrogenase n=1 Tax=Mariniphaga sediminis TaxID=1628158 RepID=A0A399D1C5_9BACT|nr:hypothetical protein [Mariniphaga sediminis]RIH65795.1 hypothetical protein D1164_09085 [Mariniphaga sediminis]